MIGLTLITSVLSRWQHIGPMLSLPSLLSMMVKQLSSLFWALEDRSSTFLGFAFQDHASYTSLPALTFNTFPPDSQVKAFCCELSSPWLPTQMCQNMTLFFYN